MTNTKSREGYEFDPMKAKREALEQARSEYRTMLAGLSNDDLEKKLSQGKKNGATFMSFLKGEGPLSQGHKLEVIMTEIKSREFGGEWE